MRMRYSLMGSPSRDRCPGATLTPIRRTAQPRIDKPLGTFLPRPGRPRPTRLGPGMRPTTPPPATDDRPGNPLRRVVVPPITYPDLPVAARRDDIAAAIRERQVVVVAGETGSGKT